MSVNKENKDINNEEPNNQHSVDPVIIKGKFFEISGSMLRIDAEKDLIKEIIEQIADATGQDKKIITKAARMFHKSNKDEVLQETDDVIAFHDKIMGMSND